MNSIILDSKKNNYWVLLTVTILITLHLQVFIVAGFGVSLGLLLFPVWLGMTYIKKGFKLSRQGAYLFIGLSIFPLLYFPILYELGEFFKTYGQYLISIFLILPFAYGRTSLINKGTFIRALKIFIWVLFGIALLQYIEVNFFGTTRLYNTWGSYQLYYQLELSPYDSVHRAKGFYLEPSYLGFIVLNCAWCFLFLKKKFLTIEFLPIVMTMYFSHSSFGMAGLLGIILHYVFIKQKGTIMKTIFGVGVLAAFLVYGVDKLLDSFKLTNIIAGGEGGSAFLRLVVPLFVIEEIWNDGYYFGVGFGQVEDYAYRIIKLNYGEGSINNGFYVLLCYFGLFGVVFYLFLILKYFLSKDIMFKSFLVLLFFNLNNSGAIVTPQFMFITLGLPMLTYSLVNGGKRIIS